MRPGKTIVAGGLCFAVALALLGYLAFEGKLAWAWAALDAYRNGGSVVPTETALEGQARARLQVGADADEIRPLLEDSIAIDPNGKSVFLLGELELREGNSAAALTRYRRYLEIHPTFLPAYLRVAEILAARGDAAGREAVLRQGLARFEAEVEQLTPQPDRSTGANFNDKARAVYFGYLESIARLETALVNEPAATP